MPDRAIVKSGAGKTGKKSKAAGAVVKRKDGSSKAVSKATKSGHGARAAASSSAGKKQKQGGKKDKNGKKKKRKSKAASAADSDEDKDDDDDEEHEDEENEADADAEDGDGAQAANDEEEEEGEEEVEEDAGMTEEYAERKRKMKERREKRAKARKSSLTKARGYRLLATKSGAAVDSRNLARTILSRAIIKRSCAWKPGTTDVGAKPSDPVSETVAYGTVDEYRRRLACAETPFSDRCADALLPHTEVLLRQIAADTMERAYDSGAARPSPAHVHAATRKLQGAFDFTAGVPRGLLRHAQKKLVSVGKDKVQTAAIGVGPADERQVAAEEGDTIPTQTRLLEDHKKRMQKRKTDRVEEAKKRKAAREGAKA